VSVWITTERLKLRPLRPADALIIAEYRNDPQVALYQGWALPYTIQDAERLISEMSGRVPGQEGWVQIGLELASTGKLIGDVALNVRSEEAEIGVTVSKAAQGNGYASEGLRALIAYAFGKLAISTIRAEIDPRNAAVARLLLKLGLRHVETQYGTFLNRGEWTDNAVYRVLQEEWLG
jgi:RimJ/RimL family protein N-acetyltransferase